MRVDVPMKLMELAGGDGFVDVRSESEEHQRSHGCGLHNAGAPQMQLVAALARTAGVTRALDLGSGLGYSSLWIASAVAEGGSVVGVDDDPLHTARATEIANGRDVGVRVEYVTGAVSDVLPFLEGPFDMIHDDAWFAKTPDHLDAMLALLRPGGLLTMANWFLLVDAILRRAPQRLGDVGRTELGEGHRRVRPAVGDPARSPRDVGDHATDCVRHHPAIAGTTQGGSELRMQSRRLADSCERCDRQS